MSKWNLEFVNLNNEVFFTSINGLWKGKKPPFTTTGVIRNTNFTSSGKIDYSNIEWLDVENKKLLTRQLISGDIIVERSGGGPKQPVGRVVLFDKKDGIYSFSNFTTTIRVKSQDKFNPKFVFYVLLDFYNSGKTEKIQSHTTGIRNLNFKAYKDNIHIPVISIDEQRQIVYILNSIQTAIEQQEKTIRVTQELKYAMMSKLFSEGLTGEKQKATEIGLIPVRWIYTNIGKKASLTTGGTPSRKNADYWIDGTIPWVKTGEIKNCIVHETAEKISILGLENSAAKLLPKGTLLMAMYGQGVTRGRVGILGIDATTNQACAAISSNDESEILNKFMFYYLQNQYHNIRELAHGANQRNLNLDLIKGFPLCYPSLEEQEEIIHILSKFDEKILKTEKKLELQNELFISMLNKLISGTIQVNRMECKS